jgi:hypothetical protein
VEAKRIWDGRLLCQVWERVEAGGAWGGACGWISFGGVGGRRQDDTAACCFLALNPYWYTRSLDVQHPMIPTIRISLITVNCKQRYSTRDAPWRDWDSDDSPEWFWILPLSAFCLKANSIQSSITHVQVHNKKNYHNNTGSAIFTKLCW